MARSLMKLFKYSTSMVRSQGVRIFRVNTVFAEASYVWNYSFILGEKSEVRSRDGDNLPVAALTKEQLQQAMLYLIKVPI